MQMPANTEAYLKEIQSVATKSLIQNRDISSLMQEQNDLIKANNFLLEELLNEIKNLAEELKNR